LVRGIRPRTGHSPHCPERPRLIDLRDPSVPAATVIRALALAPHPEGGHYRETWRDTAPDGGRGVGTAILFLLAAGEASHWHRVDAAELWLWHAGAPLQLSMADGEHTIGPDLSGGQALQHLVPKHAWQAARSLGAWSLVSCVVAPAFSFAGFELAPPAFTPSSVG
jgi:predicted cupin superfamily sugar epimerase